MHGYEVAVACTQCNNDVVLVRVCFCRSLRMRVALLLRTVVQLTGDRMVNGVLMDVSSYDRAMRSNAFVEQKDTHFESLTVWDTIAYAAIMRLPEGMHTRTKFARAKAMLQDLDLWDVRHSYVGAQGGGGGISGGQCRRLSVAIELIQMPSIIWCDEATSGLDSTTSFALIKYLKSIANGTTHARRDATAHMRTVATTIHQPRNDIFQLFDDIVLIANGRVVFNGAAQQVTT